MQNTKKLKMCNEYRKEHEGTKFDETIIESQHLIDLNDYAREIFPTFDRMSEERQKVIEFVILYYFNKAKFKNHVNVCIDSRGVRYNRGHNEFIDDKLMAMYVGEDICPCQLNHKGPS